MRQTGRYNLPVRKTIWMMLPALLAAGCQRREPAPAQPLPSVRSVPATTAAAPAPRPLADSAYRAELTLAKAAPARAGQGETLHFVVHIRNAGAGLFPSKPSAPGLRDEVRLSYHIFNANDHATILYDGLRAVLPADLPAGAAVDLPIEVKLPESPGAYLIVFDLVHEDIAWFETRHSPVLSVPVKAS